MKIAVLGHSMIHIRQQKFFQEVAKLGHDVLVLSPEIWHGGQVAKRAWLQGSAETHYELLPLVGMADDEKYGPSDFTLIGLSEALEEFEPDWVYVQQEPSSQLLDQVHEIIIAESLPASLAIFTWENMAIKNPGSMLGADLIVCGNDTAQELVRAEKGPFRTVILPQVGVDVDHFQARGVIRDIDVAYIGRKEAEKGVVQLKAAWPTTRFLEWTDYLQLPWKYSQAKIVVCYSQDTDYWREQAMPYVAMEAICCGAVAIVSDAGAIPFWANSFAGLNPGLDLAPQNEPETLHRIIEEALVEEALREYQALAGREWIEENLSSRVIAKELIDAFEKHS